MTYAFVEKFLDGDVCDMMKDYMDSFAMSQPINDCEATIKSCGPYTIDKYDVFESLQEEILPRVEEVFGKSLLRTYAFARVYRPPCWMHPHIDRPACEYSLTLNVYTEGDPWAIWVRDKEKKKDKKFPMQQGDALFYMGVKYPHWRTKRTEGVVYQTFFHFVDKNGPYANLQNDIFEREEWSGW